MQKNISLSSKCFKVSKKESCDQSSFNNKLNLNVQPVQNLGNGQMEVTRYCNLQNLRILSLEKCCKLFAITALRRVKNN